ncbi:unnamed protein product, partial [Ectocarpus sp. 12 AP-2014]
VPIPVATPHSAPLPPLLLLLLPLSLGLFVSSGFSPQTARLLQHGIGDGSSSPWDGRRNDLLRRRSRRIRRRRLCRIQELFFARCRCRATTADASSSLSTAFSSTIAPLF